MSDVIRAATGIQELLRITATPAGDEAKIGKVLNGQTIAVAGAYQCDVDSAGIGTLQVHLKASAVTGTVTPKVDTLYADGGTHTESAGTALAANTQQDLTVSVVGEKKTRVTITVAAASSATFSRAEVNGL